LDGAAADRSAIFCGGYAPKLIRHILDITGCIFIAKHAERKKQTLSKR
jgi:hypothetical protein